MFLLNYHLTNLGMLSLLGIVLLMLVGQRQQRQGALSENPMQAALRLTGWILIWLGLVGFLTGVSGGLAIIILPAFVLVALGIRTKVRRAEDRMVYSAVASSVAHEIALVENLRGLGREIGGETGRRVDHLVRRLAGGMEYSQAAYEADLTPSREAALAFKLGQEHGRLPELLEALTGDSANLRRSTQGYLDRVFGFSLTALVLLALLTGILAFLVIKIVPIFRMILDDFELSPPPPGELLMVLVSTYYQYGPLAATPVAILFAYFFAFVLYYLGWVRRLPWGIRWLHGPIEEARFLTALAAVIEAGIPFPAALSATAAAYRHDYLAQRAEHIAEDEVAGGLWIENLVKHRIVTKGEAELLKAAAQAGNLPWVLREIAAGKMRHHALRLQPFLDTWLPLLIGFLALHVVGLVFLLIEPLSTLVMILSEPR